LPTELFVPRDVAEPSGAPLVRPGWWRTLFAVLCGGFVAALMTFILQSELAGTLGWPEARYEGIPGWGWPWRVDGPWSLAADIGPALVFGATFAWCTESVMRGSRGIPSRRAVFALTAAAFALTTRATSGDAAVVVGPVLTAALVVIARSEAARPRRPIPWSWKPVALSVPACVALAVATVSYGRLHALAAEPATTTTASGRVQATVPLRGIGHGIVNLVSVRVPNAPDVRVGVWNLPGTHVGPVDGVSIHTGEAIRLALRAPSRCARTRTIDRLEVRMHVARRQLDQVIRLPEPVPVACA
jgi:hypothetical protein